MARSQKRRIPGLERLEAREVLSAVGPDPLSQVMLERINLARTDPVQAAELVTTNLDFNMRYTLDHYNVDVARERRAIERIEPMPPVAWDDRLADAAQSHSQDMDTHKMQSHTSSNGQELHHRLDRAGFRDRAGETENAFAYAKSVDMAMQAFLIDYGVPDKSHRRNIMEPETSPNRGYTHVGIGIVESQRSDFGPLVVTQNFARSTEDQPYLLGVAYEDKNDDGLYSLGEGRGGVKIEATNLKSGESESIKTWKSGGYQMPLDPGHYRVTARVSGEVLRSEEVRINNHNVKVDFVLSEPWSRQEPPVVKVTPPKTETSTPTLKVETNSNTNTRTSKPKVETTSTSKPKVETTSKTTEATVSSSTRESRPAAVAVQTARGTGSTADFEVDWITTWKAWDVSTGRRMK